MSTVSTISDDDRNTVAKFVHEQTSKIIDGKIYTYHALAEKIREIISPEMEAPTENAIKQFMRKYQGQANKNNKVIMPLFNFLTDKNNGLPDTLANEISDEVQRLDIESINPTTLDADRVARLQEIGPVFSKWFNVKSDETMELSQHFSGDFFLFRKSSEDAKVIIKSVLRIEYLRQNNTIVVCHKLIDRLDAERVSYGMMFQMGNNIYILFENGSDKSMETLVLNHDDRKTKMVSGYIMTSDVRHTPIFAHALIVTRSAEYAKLDNRIIVKEFPQTNSPIIDKINKMLNTKTATKIKA